MPDILTPTPARDEETFLLIGSGIAALSAAIEIRRILPRAAIVMVGEESALPYYRPSLCADLLSPTAAETYALYPPAWYSRQGLFLLSGRRATRLLPRQKQIELEGGTTLSYDKCVLATGAQNTPPPIPGRSLPGVFSLRSLSDREALTRYLRPEMRAVVVGADRTGLATAWQLYLAGCHVSVLESSPTLPCESADPALPHRILAAAEGRGVTIRLGASLTQIEGEGRVERVILPGEYYSTDLVLFCGPGRPHIELAREAGLETEQGILVNARMMTGKYGIYACGDCAQLSRELCRDWESAANMGRCAGRNAAGEDALYQPTSVPYTLCAFGETFTDRPAPVR